MSNLTNNSSSFVSYASPRVQEATVYQHKFSLPQPSVATGITAVRSSKSVHTLKTANTIVSYSTAGMNQVNAPRRKTTSDLAGNKKFSSQVSNRQIKNLQFRNPGRLIEDFDPECSRREMRKVQRRFYRETHRRNRVYDEHGVRLADGGDVCDCLLVACPGCHLPCPRCTSTKCGAECRCNRCWFYSEQETEGTRSKIVCDLIPSSSN